MTNESVLRNYKHMCEKCKRTYPHPQCHYCDKPIAIKALEKQVAKKPNYVRQFERTSIGLCSCNYTVDSTMRYCKNCGQKIDWSDEYE